MNEIKISTGVIASLIFSTWVFTTVVMVCQAQINTENRMRIERLEDEAMGINLPVTHEIKPILKGASNG